MNLSTTVRHISSPESDEMIMSYLEGHPQGVLTTITPKGLPQNSVVNLFQLGDHVMAFMTKRETRKHKNLSNSPEVSFMTYDPFSRTELEIEGLAILVDDRGQEEKILQIIADDASKGRRHISPYVDDMDDYVLYVLYPRKMHLVTYWARADGIEAFHETMSFDVKTVQ